MSEEWDRRHELAVDLIFDAMRVTGNGCVRLAPLTHEPCTAYADASRDVLEINEWINAGFGVGLVGGGKIAALDWEHRAKKGTDGLAARAELQSVLGALSTRCTTTKSGGLHDLVLLPPGNRVRGAQGVLRGLGVPVVGLDVVTNLIRLPPTPGYTVASEARIAPISAAWLDAIEDRPEPPRRITLRESTDATKVLRLAADDVAALSAGRSEALNACAYRFAAHDIDESVIVDELMRAAEVNGSVAKRGRRACLSIIRGGLRARVRKGAA